MGESDAVQTSVRWEYRTLSRKTEEFLLDDLNAAGQEGWELVTVIYHRDPKGLAEAMAWTAFVKRLATGECVARVTREQIAADEVERKARFASMGLDDVNTDLKLEGGALPKGNLFSGDSVDLGEELRLEGDEPQEALDLEEVADAEIIDAEELSDDSSDRDVEWPGLDKL